MSDRKLTNKADQAIALRTPAPARRSGRKPMNVDALDGHLGYFIRRAQVWVFQDFIRALSSADIRPAQYSVLIVIGANPGLSQSDLADTLNIERARLVHLLDKLEKRGWTERQPSPTDRRSHALHLTREGQKMLKRAKALADQHEAHLIERLGVENHKLMLTLLRDFAREK